jgi:hypothetical protein
MDAYRYYQNPICRPKANRQWRVLRFSFSPFDSSPVPASSQLYYRLVNLGRVCFYLFLFFVNCMTTRADALHPPPAREMNHLCTYRRLSIEFCLAPALKIRAPCAVLLTLPVPVKIVKHPPMPFKAWHITVLSTKGAFKTQRHNRSLI